jgi:hypothetical protein
MVGRIAAHPLLYHEVTIWVKVLHIIIDDFLARFAAMQVQMMV